MARSAECSFLKAGQLFESRQSEDDRRCVRVRVHACDVERGNVCGEIVGKRAGGADGVVKMWEGEMIDNRNYTFQSSQWSVNWDAHRLHWNSMAAFRPLRAEVDKNGGAALDLAACPHLFMRWKEQVPAVPVRGSEPAWMPQLHHVCFVKSDGRLIFSRYRFPDSPCSSGTRLELFPKFHDGLSGYNFPTYQLQ